MQGKQVQLNKFLANAGVTSRRKVADLVMQKRVKINGQVASKLAIRINPEKDKVLVDGRVAKLENQRIYIMLNKPKGLVSTVEDEFNRPKVLDLVKVSERIYPIGRLDQDSSGLILLTNDGELTNRLTHPKFHIPKTYELLISGKINSKQLEQLEKGVKLKEGMSSPTKIRILKRNSKEVLLEIILYEGWNRQIRRMCGIVGLNLLDLKRVAIGDLRLGDLKVGKWRFLTDKELNSLLVY